MGIAPFLVRGCLVGLRRAPLGVQPHTNYQPGLLVLTASCHGPSTPPLLQEALSSLLPSVPVSTPDCSCPLGPPSAPATLPPVPASTSALVENPHLEWRKKMWFRYTVEYYSAVKKNEILPFATRMEQKVRC